MRKFLPYILIIIVLVGLLSSAGKAYATLESVANFCNDEHGLGTVPDDINACIAAATACKDKNGNVDTAPGSTTRNCVEQYKPPANQPPPTTPTNPNYQACMNLGLSDSATCAANNPDTSTYTACMTAGGKTPQQCEDASVAAATPPAAPKTEFEKYVSDHGCGIGKYIPNGGDTTLLPGCLVEGSYYLFYALPSLILWLAAYFFNVLIALTLTSKLFAGSTFIPLAWAVVRDLSNIFFILILLYIAIKIILGLGGSDVKKMIARVVIIALLINFSMFFTEVIIDTSNVLALIFYNKMQVSTKDANGNERPYDLASGEKDVAGGMVNAFDPTRILTPEFFTGAGTVNTGVTGVAPQKTGVSATMLIGITIVSGALMLFAAYALFVSGISFVGRLVELWTLIISSPFAFMSSTVPELSGIESWGWKGWLSRLLTASFMAPAFMFFLYFIFLLIGTNLFKNMITGQGTVETLLLVIIPAVITLVLLLKSVKLAKKSAGEMGASIAKIGVQLGGLAVGGLSGLALKAAIGGIAAGGRATVGHVAGNLAESNRMRDWAARSRFGAGVLKATSGVASSSFDARGIKVAGKDLSGATGLKLGKAQEGGFVKARAEKVKRKEEFTNKLLDTSDYGKAELTRGGMTADQANRVINQMAAGGMPIGQALGHQAALMGAGMSMADVTVASRHLNQAKRDDFANRIQNTSMTNRIAANKIRKSVTQQAQAAQLAQVTAALAAAQAAAAAPAAPAPAAPLPPAPPPPAPCWVAEVLYGVNDQRTHSARLWAGTNDNWFTKLYKENGKTWARWLTIHTWAQPVVKPIWDIMATKGRLLAIKVRSNESFLNEKFNYLLEKVK